MASVSAPEHAADPTGTAARVAAEAFGLDADLELVRRGESVVYNARLATGSGSSGSGASGASGATVEGAPVVLRLMPIRDAGGAASTRDSVAAELAIHDLMASAGVSVPRPIPSREGDITQVVMNSASSGSDGGGDAAASFVASVLERAAGRGFDHTVDAADPAFHEAWARTLARMHKASAAWCRDRLAPADAAGSGGVGHSSRRGKVLGRPHYTQLPIMEELAHIDSLGDGSSAAAPLAEPGSATVASAMARLRKWLNEHIDEETDPERFTLIHSDFHFGNMFLDRGTAASKTSHAGSEGGSSKAVYCLTVLDFGEAHWGWCAFDVAFVLTSVDIQTRLPPSPRSFDIDVEAFTTRFLDAYRAENPAAAAKWLPSPDADAAGDDAGGWLSSMKQLRLCLEYLYSHRALRRHAEAVRWAEDAESADATSETKAKAAGLAGDVLPEFIMGRMRAFMAVAVEDLEAAA